MRVIRRPAELCGIYPKRLGSNCSKFYKRTRENTMQCIYRIIAVLFVLGLTGCAMAPASAPDAGVVKVSGNVHEIMDVDYRGIFGSEESLIKRGVDQAQEFAAAQGKVAVPIEARIHRVGILADWAWFYYKFSLAAPSSSESHIKFSEITIERDARLSNEFYEVRHKQKAINSYDDLVKLDELRKKGIITEIEFEQQKAKILSKP
jgi:hypothetical protein